MATPKNPFNEKRYGSIYPLANSLRQGYAVTRPDKDPADNQPSARMVNIRGDWIDFYIENMSTDFAMAGSTGQSRTVRQFFPHNIVQPSIKITGRAPNDYQYNRLAAFVRVAQHSAVSIPELTAAGVPLRTEKIEGANVVTPTVALYIRNGNKKYPFERNPNNWTSGVKGRHRPWKLEGYVKSMGAGARRHNPAPQFEFEFIIAESFQNNDNVGIWSDTRVLGSQLKSWADVFQHHGQGVVANSHTAAAGDNFNEGDGPAVSGGGDPDRGTPAGGPRP